VRSAAAGGMPGSRRASAFPDLSIRWWGGATRRWRWGFASFDMRWCERSWGKRERLARCSARHPPHMPVEATLGAAGRFRRESAAQRLPKLPRALQGHRDAFSRGDAHPLSRRPFPNVEKATASVFGDLRNDGRAAALGALE